MSPLIPGINVASLQIWSSDNSGSVLSGLYFCFALGNILGPILAGFFLSNEPDNPARQLAQLISLPHLTNFQILSLLLGCAFVLMGVLCLLFPGMCRSCNPGPSTAAATQDRKTAKDSGGGGLSSSHLLPYSAIFVFVIGFLSISNGINFGFSNFLTYYSMESALQQTKAFGARATTIFFATQTGARLVMTFLSIWLRPFWIITLDMTILVGGSLFLKLSPEDCARSFLIGVGLIGIGIGNLIPSGLAWTKAHINLSSTMYSVILTSATIGAQIFKVPISMFIEETPVSLINILCGATAAVPPCFLIAKIISDRNK